MPANIFLKVKRKRNTVCAWVTLYDQNLRNNITHYVLSKLSLSEEAQSGKSFA